MRAPCIAPHHGIGTEINITDFYYLAFMKPTINPNDKYFILENGQPKQVDTYEEWNAWSDNNRERINTTLYFVEDGVVANFFFYGRVETFQYDDDGKPLLWWVNEFDMDSSEYQKIYDKGIRVDGIDLPEIIKARKELEEDDVSYEGLDSFSMFATQEDAIKALEGSYGDWRSKVIVLDPERLPLLDLNF